MDTAPADTVNVGENTPSASVVVAVCDPEVPVMVMVDCPRGAVELAVRVIVLEPVVGLGANDAVTPAGRPEAASVTFPVKPYWLLTNTQAVVEVPCPRVTVPLLERLKVGT